MFAPSQSLVRVGAGLLGLRTTLKLKYDGNGRAAQEKVLKNLLGKFAKTAFGSENGIEAGMGYNEFSQRVSPRAYEDFHDYVERMKRGEADVLWPGTCAYYAVSSGTTAGRTKYLPITNEMVDHFSKAGLASLLFYTTRVGKSSIFAGRHLFLGGSATLSPIPESLPFQAYGGDLSGITALNLPSWVERYLYEPGLDIAQMSDWPKKIKAIVERCWSRDIRVVAGIPSWVLILAEAFAARAKKEHRPHPNLQALWPNLECLIHGGVPISPFKDQLKQALSPTVNFHEVYPASEGFIAAQDSDAAAGLRLMTDAGIFYEFLALKDYDDETLYDLGPKIVPLEGVRIGIDYVLLMTTPAGLCRYVIGDVVRFISTTPPRLIYVGRTKLQLSAFGEHVIEKELTDSLLAVCQRHNWNIVNFHVAPMFAEPEKGQRRGRHEWWIELKAPMVETPIGKEMAAQLDGELIKRNDDYEAKRKGLGLEPPVVRLVMPGVFEQWMRHAGKWGGQNKMPRCRSDRVIADQLAQLTRFHQDS
ncbi:MAG TPA: GH3 auxin-responsive promoter family protein [Opitutaceae bacterium]|nr:GH3 auxin-responsive promoter family protein [Opitutaceae bacterium]